MLRSAGYKRPSRRYAPTESVAGVQAPLAPGRRAGGDPAQRHLRRAAPPDQAPDHGGAYRPGSQGAVPDAVSDVSGARYPRGAARRTGRARVRSPAPCDAAPPAAPKPAAGKNLRGVGPYTRRAELKGNCRQLVRRSPAGLPALLHAAIHEFCNGRRHGILVFLEQPLRVFEGRRDF